VNHIRHIGQLVRRNALVRNFLDELLCCRGKIAELQHRAVKPMFASDGIGAFNPCHIHFCHFNAGCFVSPAVGYIEAGNCGIVSAAYLSPRSESVALPEESELENLPRALMRIIGCRGFCGRCSCRSGNFLKLVKLGQNTEPITLII